MFLISFWDCSLFINDLDESEVAQRKAFLRSFVKKIVVDKERVRLYYNLPVPPDGKKMETVGVLDTVHYGGDRVTIGRTFELAFALTF